MTDTEFKLACSKYIVQMREQEEQLRQLGKTQIKISPDELKKKVEAGIIPKELSDWFINHVREENRRFKEWQQFIKDNPDMPEEERLAQFEGLPRTLSKEESLKWYEEAVNIATFNHLWITSMGDGDVKQTIMGALPAPGKQLYQNAELDDYFGVANAMAGIVYHLIDLLKLKKPTKTLKGIYEAIGTITISYGQNVSLEYQFVASSLKEAEAMVEKYKKIMKTSGLKLWLATWKEANICGSVEFTCPYVDILSCMSDKRRQSYFSVKEKQENWEVMKLLKRTTIKSSQQLAQTKRVRKITRRWIEQPMVNILGGEEEVDVKGYEGAWQEAKYPRMVTLRLLNTPNKKDFAPIFYKNSTLGLDPNAILLAFNIQTRAWQLRSHPKKESNPDWKTLFSLGNVEKTAKKNPSAAKAIIRSKMEDYKEDGIIADYTATKAGITIVAPPIGIDQEGKKNIKKKAPANPPLRATT